MRTESDSPYENKDGNKRLGKWLNSLKICDNCSYHEPDTPEYIYNRIISESDGEEKQENIRDEKNEEDWEHRLIISIFVKL
jgi:hypothetical protein